MGEREKEGDERRRKESDGLRERGKGRSGLGLVLGRFRDAFFFPFVE